MSPRPLGILAGRGIYPKLLFDAITRTGVPVVVVGMAGQTDVVFFHNADIFKLLPIGAIAGAARFFRTHNVDSIFFAGGIQRHGVWRHLRPDRRGAGLIADALLSGDDTLLRHTADAFGEYGVTVSDPASYIRDMLAPRGHLAGPPPTDSILADLDAATTAAFALGTADRGQAAIAKEGRVVAVEGRAGTDHLIRSASARGGVIAKVVKPGQDRRFDLPAIGPDTVCRCHAHGMVAIGVEAGGVLLLEKEKLMAASDAAGVCLVGIAGSGDSGITHECSYPDPLPPQ